ncbi:MAG: rod shape-determining protein, partial [Candidatus Magasanikbacteria bacterium]|nr:rod shape-determining protein [Candidatus Magasanikbacteria bacterium]
GSAGAMDEKTEFPMRGRDVITGLPKEIMISSEHIKEALSRSVREIVDSIKMTLEVTPPELTADIHERGILLTGGGSLLRGLNNVISHATEIPVRIADDPLTSVVRGTGALLEADELLAEIILPSARNSRKR